MERQRGAERKVREVARRVPRDVNCMADAICRGAVHSYMLTHSAGEPNPCPQPTLMSDLWRGARGLCPACGKGRMFAKSVARRDIDGWKHIC